MMDRPLVYVLSLDQSLLRQKTWSDTRERFKDMVRKGFGLRVWVPTSVAAKRIKVNRDFEIIPVGAKIKWRSYYRLGQRLKQNVIRERVDLVVTNDAVLGILAKFFVPGVKVQVSFFGQRLTNWRWLISRPQHIFLWLAELLALYGADSIRTDTIKDGERLGRWFFISPSKLVTIPVIPHSMMLERFRARGRKELSVTGQQILTISALTPNKDLGNLLKAMVLVKRELPTAQLTIIGSGPDEAKLRNLGEKLGINQSIKWVKQVDYDQLPRYYQQADLYVCAASQEGLPRVLIEAIVAQVPVVTTDIPGAYDVIMNGESGIIVPRRQPRKLAQAIIWQLRHRSEGGKMARRACGQNQELFDYDRQMDRLIGSWHDLIREQR